MDNIIIVDQDNEIIDINVYEVEEQLQAKEYIK